jgi:hypothetical protein
MEKRFESFGLTHSLRVFPNDNNTGWLVESASMGKSAIASLPQSEAVELAKILLAGPGEIKYVCEIHKKISGTCLDCLL